AGTTGATAAAAAREALPPGVRYVNDAGPGITRRLVRGRFAYFAPDGTRIRDRDTIARIDALAIPPAYQDVWICPDPRGHIQATGRDARGRKQYRYHPAWIALRDENKYDRLLAFGRALPRLRRRARRDLQRNGMPREKVL
ncbi:DNA topoisomerase IB, partial [Acinetobacter baumannii]